jgi:transposase
MIEGLPPARSLLADRAYSSIGFRDALVQRGITPCIPPHAKHKIQHSYDRVLYRQRDKIENLFARLKDWRRIHTRYDRCAHTFLSAIAFATSWCNANRMTSLLGQRRVSAITFRMALALSGSRRLPRSLCRKIAQL